MGKKRTNLMITIMIYDFIISALPYVAIGFAVAFVCVAKFAAKQKSVDEQGQDKQGMPASRGFFIASMLMYTAAFMQCVGGEISSSAVTFFCLGSCFLCFFSQSLIKERKSCDENNADEDKK